MTKNAITLDCILYPAVDASFMNGCLEITKDLHFQVQIFEG